MEEVSMITNKTLLTVKESALITPLSEQEKMRVRIAIEIAAQIQEYRAQQSLSQKDLANKIGVSQEMISRWENAEDNLTLATIAKIAVAIEAEPICPFQIPA
jgi:DNA-binding XRE family transcriptional regulator